MIRSDMIKHVRLCVSVHRLECTLICGLLGAIQRLRRNIETLKSIKISLSCFTPHHNPISRTTSNPIDLSATRHPYAYSLPPNRVGKVW